MTRRCAAPAAVAPSLMALGSDSERDFVPTDSGKDYSPCDTPQEEIIRCQQG